MTFYSFLRPNQNFEQKKIVQKGISPQISKYCRVGAFRNNLESFSQSCMSQNTTKGDDLGRHEVEFLKR